MNLPRQTLWSALPFLINAGFSLAAVPLFYKWLGSESYALWFYVLTWMNAFSFVDLGMGVTTGRYVGLCLGSGDEKKAKAFWETGHLLGLLALVVVTNIFLIVGWFVVGTWFQLPSEDLWLFRGSLLAGGLGLFLTYYAQLWQFIVQAHLDFVFLARVKITTQLTTLLGMLALAFLTSNPCWLLAFAALISCGEIFFLAKWSQKTYGLGLGFCQVSWNLAREMVGFAWKMSSLLLLSSLTQSCDRFLLGRLASALTFSYYLIPSNVGARLNALSLSLTSPVFSHTSRSVGEGKAKGAKEVYQKSFDLLWGWYLLAAWGAWLWHGPLLQVWLGKELAQAVDPLFAPILTGYCLSSIGSISGAQLSSLHLQSYQIFFQGLTLVLTVVGLLGGWSIGGVTGAAYGFLLSRLGFLAQDLYMAWFLGGGGWLAWSTWRHLGFQSLVGGAFYSLYWMSHFHLFAGLGLALTHGIAVSSFLWVASQRK